METRRVIRFFGMFPPAHPVARVGLATTTVLGVPLIIFGVAAPTQVFVPLVLLQALAASSGFAAPARRGYYDLLLTLGHSRLQVGVAHWAMSVAPGLGAWCLLIAVESVMAPGAVTLLNTGVAAAMVAVSTCPWALSVALPRLSGGVVLAVITSFLLAVIPGGTRAELAAAIDAGGAAVIALAAAIGMASGAAALRFIATIDLPLEAAQ